MASFIRRNFRYSIITTLLLYSGSVISGFAIPVSNKWHYAISKASVFGCPLNCILLSNHRDSWVWLAISAVITLTQISILLTLIILLIRRFSFTNNRFCGAFTGALIGGSLVILVIFSPDALGFNGSYDPSLAIFILSPLSIVPLPFFASVVFFVLQLAILGHVVTYIDIKIDYILRHRQKPISILTKAGKYLRDSRSISR